MLSALFLICWVNGPRFVYHSPVLTDYWAYTFLVLGLLVMGLTDREPTRLLDLALIGIVFVGVVFREIVLVLGVVPLGFTIWHERSKLSTRRFVFAALPLIAGLISLTGVHLIARQTNHHSFVTDVAYYALELKLLDVFIALCLAFGPVLFIVVFHHKTAAEFLRQNPKLKIFLAITLFLVMVGGDERERYLMMVFPVFLLLLGVVLERCDWPRNVYWLAAVTVLQALAFRIASVIPAQAYIPGFRIPILTPHSGGYTELIASAASRKMRAAISIEYILVGAFIFATLFWWERHRKSALKH